METWYSEMVDSSSKTNSNHEKLDGVEDGVSLGILLFQRVHRPLSNGDLSTDDC